MHSEVEQAHVSRQYLAAWNNTLDTIFESSDRKLFVIEVVHGMCNRIRAYASAALLAKKSARRLVLVWKPDIHVNARFFDLFDSSFANAVVVEGDGFRAHLESSGQSTDHYDYMNSNEKGVLIVTQSAKHIYVRSSFELSSDAQYSEAELRNVYTEISQHISRPVKEHLTALMGRKKRATRMIGAHVRMLGDLKSDIPGIEKLPESSVNGLELMYEAEVYRHQCHVQHFVPQIQKELERFPRTTIFIASDSQEAIEILKNAFEPSNNVIHTEISKLLRCRGRDRRGPFCSQLALSEFLFLTTSDMLFTSRWSSTTDLLLRLHNGTHSCGCAE